MDYCPRQSSLLEHQLEVSFLEHLPDRTWETEPHLYAYVLTESHVAVTKKILSIVLTPIINTSLIATLYFLFLSHRSRKEPANQ